MKHRAKKPPRARTGDRVRHGDKLGIVMQTRLGHAAVLWEDGANEVLEISELTVVMSRQDYLAEINKKLGR